MKLWICCALVSAILLCAGTSLAADKTFSIGGVIHFRYAEKIKILLLTREEFEKRNHASYKLTVKPDAKALAAGKAPFQMRNVPAGAYVLLAYQDNNGNDVLDKNFFQFNEPWGTFRPQRPGMGFRMAFEDLVFNLDQNLHDIQIRLTQ